MFSTEFTAQMGAPTSKLCWCWKLTRADEAVLGFTSHDRDLVIDGIVYTASSGFTASDIDAKSGFAIDNSAASAMLSSDLIAHADIEAGIYDGAQVLVSRVSWEASQIFGEIWRGYFGKITQSGERFSVELIGETSRLSRTTGRVFSRICDAEFGDNNCGLNVNDYPQGTLCPRTFSACKDQFSNALNYRGFPYLIGDDAMQSGPASASARDGGSRYKGKM
jgi:hypothetical protein